MCIVLINMLVGMYIVFSSVQTWKTIIIFFIALSV